MTKKLRNSRGFTFVELLVVVTIIAVLTAVAVMSYSSTNKKSRDTKRKSDLAEIRSALEIARTECGAYPEVNLYAVGVTCGGTTYIASNRMPNDPKTGNPYTYSPAAGGATYTLCADDIENEATYCVYNP